MDESNIPRIFSIMLIVLSIGLSLAAFSSSSSWGEGPPDTRDGAPPTCSITSPQNNSQVSGLVVITGTAGDDVSVQVVELSIDGQGHLAVDTSGNGSWATWKYDWNTTEYDDGWYIINASSWDGTLDSGPATIWVYVNNTPPPNQPPGIDVDNPNDQDMVSGVVVINGTAWDDQGVTAVEVTIDNSGNLATDTSGNGSWYTWEFQWNTTQEVDGWHTINVSSWDGSLASPPVVLQVLVNNSLPPNQPPTVNITFPANNSEVNGTVMVTGTAWDDGLVHDVEVWVDNGGGSLATDTSGNNTWYTWQFSWNTSGLSNGWHVFHAGAWDGSLGSTNADLYVYVNNTSPPLNSPPGISISSPADYSMVNATVIVSGSAWDDVGVLNIEINIDNGPGHLATDTSGNGTFYTWQFVWNTLNYTNGPHTLLASAWDGELGSQPNADLHVTINNSQPQPNSCPDIAITYPTPNLELGGVINITGTASDDTAVAQVNVIINGTWYNATDSSGNGSWATWYYSFQSTILPDDEWRISAAAHDGICWEDVHVWVDLNNAVPNALPQIQINSPAPDQNVSGLLNISGTATDDNGLTLVKIVINNTEYNATDTSGNGSWASWYFLFNTSTLPNGEWQITVAAFDGTQWEDAHVWVNVNNTMALLLDSEDEMDEEEEDEEEDETTPGFGVPLVIAAMAATVVVASFRSRLPRR